MRRISHLVPAVLYRPLLGIVMLLFSASFVSAAEVVVISSSADFVKKVTRANAIYDIQCDVNLNGASVTIPAQSVLRFSNGSISNGRLTGNQTMIENGSNRVIFNNVQISDAARQFINDFMYVDWFWGKSDADKTQNAVDFAKKNRNAIRFLTRVYTFDHTVTIGMSQFHLFGSGAGGEYGELGPKIVAAAKFTSSLDGAPLFYVTGELRTAKATLGVASGRVTGLTFSTDRKNDVFQFKMAADPARPMYIDHCSFIKCKTAIRVLDNGGSTALGFLYVENCTMTGNMWNVVAHGRHSLLGLYFCKNVAEQCDGCINLGYSEEYSAKPYDSYAPRQVDYSASANITICDNLLEGTVDCIYINGGKCIVNIERNYFETSRRQFVVLSFSNPSSIAVFQNNYLSKDDTVDISYKNCKYSSQSMGKGRLHTSNASAK